MKCRCKAYVGQTCSELAKPGCKRCPYCIAGHRVVGEEKKPKKGSATK